MINMFKNKKRVAISVIMTSYNHENFVSQAIESVLKQTYKNLEFIIVDDGSADQTASIIQQYARQDSRIKFHAFSQNKGASIAFEKALQHAKGKYVAIINSDDEWVLNKLEKQFHFLEAHKEIGAVFSRVQAINEQGLAMEKEQPPSNTFNQPPNRTRYQWLNQFFYNGNCLCHPSVLIRRECYKKCGVYQPYLASLPDFDMWIRLCMKYDIHILEERLTRFRVRDNNKNESADTLENQIRYHIENAMVLKNFLHLSVEDFNRVFEDKEKIKHTALVKFYLGKLALEVNHSAHKLFGLSQLHEFFSNPTKVKKYQSEIGVEYKDLHKLGREVDIFNLKSRANSNKLTTYLSRFSDVFLRKLRYSGPSKPYC